VTGRRLRDRLRTAKDVSSALLALVLVAFVVVRGSEAAFTAEVRNDGNSFVAGNVRLEDGAAGALFQVRDLGPGDSEARCITVDYIGTSRNPGTVRMHGGGYVDRPGPRDGSRGLGDLLRLTVEEGTGTAAPDGSCRGFRPAATTVDGLSLREFNARHGRAAVGTGSWEPTPMGSRTYRLTVALDPSTSDVEHLAGASDIAFGWVLHREDQS
jgi:hypothetical protein